METPSQRSEQPSAPFALGTFQTADAGDAFPGLVVGDRVLDLRQALPSAPTDLLAVLAEWQVTLPELHRLASDRSRPGHALNGLRVLAPVQPRQIFQAGANYRQHVIDLEVAHRSPDDPRSPEQARAEVAAVMDRRAREDQPYVFIGLPSSITGPYDDVELPSWAAKPDWELELAVVIGCRTHRVETAQALDHVAGYTIANDLTDRASVFRPDMPAIGTDWLRSKNAPGFTPLGPYLVPAEFVGDPGDLQVTLTLNGQTMQDESTKDMLFGVARLIAYISQYAVLWPGDLVLTGSPAGNGLHWGRLLRDGDVMEGTITGLGGQRTRCVAPRQARGSAQ
ncbi:fumarylacetoacetate hydrolase family protein [Actinocrinis sp.]|uniref:fumarylacetoacetate hydrolase family protein n=1 Tax=Actinocrinis sp. TaxID=1920516 RepID=UPI002D45E722|nr:fumarylacetoacetate hydrolase family protein [Actinocrinis sp.]HZP52101.1 fumarylacetoacetate hydrolase family protein [Actinocrinis sp.]